MCGKEMSVDEILSEAEKDLAFYGENGGITLSGGEPLAQGEKTISLLEVCKKKGLNTVIETCGQVDTDVLLKAIPLVDLFLWDIKDTEVDRHKKYTGVSGEKILKNLILADLSGAKTRLRCILVNGVNTSKEHYRKIAETAMSLSHCEGVEWIPYHAYGGTKATFLGHEDNGKVEWIPTEEQVNDAKFTVQSMGVTVF
jgi:pyruvate formate lyase activating enzyme